MRYMRELEEKSMARKEGRMEGRAEGEAEAVLKLLTVIEEVRSIKIKNSESDRRSGFAEMADAGSKGGNLEDFYESDVKE